MTTIATRLRRLVPVGLFSVAVALGIAAYPAIASATWDIEYYDNCIKTTTKPTVQCCLESGGVPNRDASDCMAPPLDMQGSTQTPIPPRKSVVPTVPGVQPPMVGQP
jgi:hypothetical protein